MAVSTNTPFGPGMLEREETLSPPVARQPYTPPPRQGEDIESGREEQYELQSSNGHLMNGTVEGKMPSVDGIDDMAIGASPAEYAGSRRKRKDSPGLKAAVKPQTVANMLRKGIVEHQLGLSLNLLLLLAMSWAIFPSLREQLEAFFLLSYKTSRGGQQEAMYGQGPRDLGFVVGCIVLFTGLRAFLIDYILTPLAGLWGIRNLRTRDRFAEQSFLLLYYLIYWNWGVYLFVSDTPILFPTSSTNFSEALNTLLVSLWTDFPRLLINGNMKLYYLSQLSFWIQQIMVVHLEEKRKDHYQMLTHHFVTVALMSTSYCHRQWRVGSAVLACMDIIEIIFPVCSISLNSRGLLSRKLTLFAIERQDTEVSWLPNGLRYCVWPVCGYVAHCTTWLLSYNLLELICACEPGRYAIWDVQSQEGGARIYCWPSSGSRGW